jgi:hypothetical protein
MTSVSPFSPRPRLHLVPREPQPRRRVAVRISVLDGRAAFGRAGPFRLTESDLDQLINAATRLEARGKKS